NDGLLGRNWLGGRAGDRSNALLAAVGFNLRQLLRFLKHRKFFLRSFLQPLLAACAALALRASLESQQACDPLFNAQSYPAYIHETRFLTANFSLRRTNSPTY
ncbi:MAG TPA: hypothetical protein VGW37_07970, partial [Terriglobia bacterium]|nr:hypothetical protein [Terriglobia bacterium]